MTEPVFLFAVERSGSTLLQRLLSAHGDIAATGETWLLLPHLYALRRQGIYGEYGHARAVRGIEEFIEHMPYGRNDYDRALSQFLTQMYGLAASGERYFLDKTPHYSYIAGDILNLFPESKAIFLWRNPLSVVASIIESWGTPGNWDVYIHERHLLTGTVEIVQSYVRNRDRSHALRFEDLVTDPARELTRVLEFLGLESSEQLVPALPSIRLDAGDPIGTRRYDSVSTEPIDKWRQVLRNPLRKLWSRRFLHKIGQDYLTAMGYTLDALLRELDSVPLTLDNVLSDSFRMTYGGLWTMSEKRVLEKRGERRWLMDNWADRRKKQRPFGSQRPR